MTSATKGIPRLLYKYLEELWLTAQIVSDVEKLERSPVCRVNHFTVLTYKITTTYVVVRHYAVV